MSEYPNDNSCNPCSRSRSPNNQNNAWNGQQQPRNSRNSQNWQDPKRLQFAQDDYESSEESFYTANQSQMNPHLNYSNGPSNYYNQADQSGAFDASFYSAQGSSIPACCRPVQNYSNGGPNMYSAPMRQRPPDQNYYRAPPTVRRSAQYPSYYSSQQGPAPFPQRGFDTSSPSNMNAGYQRSPYDMHRTEPPQQNLRPPGRTCPRTCLNAYPDNGQQDYSASPSPRTSCQAQGGINMYGPEQGGHPTIIRPCQSPCAPRKYSARFQEDPMNQPPQLKCAAKLCGPVNDPSVYDCGNYTPMSQNNIQQDLNIDFPPDELTFVNPPPEEPGDVAPAEDSSNENGKSSDRISQRSKASQKSDQKLPKSKIPQRTSSVRSSGSKSGQPPGRRDSQSSAMSADKKMEEAKQNSINMLSVVISTVMLLAADVSEIPDNYTSWTVKYLKCIKNEKGQYPANVKKILKMLASEDEMDSLNADKKCKCPPNEKNIKLSDENSE